MLPRVVMLDLVAPFANRNSWGHHSRCFSAALSKLVAHQRIPLSTAYSSTADIGRLTGFGLRPATPAQRTIIMAPPSYVVAPSVGQNVMYTVWEPSRLPPPYAANVDRAHSVWVPTQWGADRLAESGIRSTKISVVPEGVDSSVFRPAPRRIRSNTFRFLFVGKWERRKGVEDLIRSFVREFRSNEDVALILHFGHDSMFGKRVFDLVCESIDGRTEYLNKIRVSTRLSEDELVLLMQSCNAFVLPTKAEGWGLPILEAMACGLPCIVTNYSGHLTFSNHQNSFLIEVEKMTSVEDHHFFPDAHDHGEWAQPNLDHLCSLMRYVYEHQGAARQRGEQARRDVVRQWTWDHAAQIASRLVQ